MGSPPREEPKKGLSAIPFDDCLVGASSSPSSSPPSAAANPHGVVATEEAPTTPMESAASRTLSKYERARLVSARVVELEAGAPTTVSIEAGDTLFDIAMKEVGARLLDMKLKLYLPGGKTHTLHISELDLGDTD